MNDGGDATLTLGQVCKQGGLVRGPFGGSLKKGDFVQSGYQVYEQRHAIQGSAKGGRYYISDSKFRAMQRFAVEPGDFIVSCSGTIGRIFQIPEDAPRGIINQALLKITVNDQKIDPLFFRHYFEWGKFQGKILETTQGGAMKNMVGMAVLREVPLRLPPLAAQRAIGQSLEDADLLIASLERMITKKQAIKQGKMQELLTGRTRLPGFTRNWVPGTFEELASPVKDRTLPAQVSPDTPLVELDQIESATGRLLARSTVTSATSLKTRFQVGDVLFGKLRAYLRKFWIADTNGLCTTEIWAFRSKPGVSAEFVRFIVETDGFIEVASGAYGTHMPRSDWGTVRRYEISIPEPEEQTAIASVLMDANREIEVLRTRLAKARDIKQGMMQELLTGRTRLPVRAAVV